jgi:methylamine dehydrogenase accessory protein MauD
MSGWWLVSYVVLWSVVLALGLLVVALARQIGTLHLRLAPLGALEIDEEGLPLGSPTEPDRPPALDGEPVLVGGPGPPRLLLFISPGCRVCKEVLPGLRAATRGLRGSTAVVVSDADPETTVVAYPDRRAAGAPLVASPSLAGRFAVPGTPYLVVLDDHGVVRAKGTANDLEQLEGLVDTAARRIASGDPVEHAR